MPTSANLQSIAKHRHTAAGCDVRALELHWPWRPLAARLHGFRWEPTQSGLGCLGSGTVPEGPAA